MTNKQKRFCDEYLIDCNATQAYIRAGYSPKGAGVSAKKLLEQPEVQAYIDEMMDAQHSEKVADATEVLEYLTSVMRGESQSEVVVVEGCGDGVSEARTMMKAPEEKDRLKAGELLGKRYRLFTDKVDLNQIETPVFGGEDQLED